MKKKKKGFRVKNKNKVEYNCDEFKKTITDKEPIITYLSMNPEYALMIEHNE